MASIECLAHSLGGVWLGFQLNEVGFRGMHLLEAFGVVKLCA